MVLFQDQRGQNQRRQFQSIQNLVLRRMIDGMVNPLAWIESYISKYFKMFIAGITMFDEGNSNALGHPAYHRPSSCGPNNARGPEYNRNNLDCTGIEVGSNEYYRRRRNSWNCFIERLIYDEMYIRLRNIPEQNFGHRFQRQYIERVFSTCFPVLDIHVNKVSVEMSRDLIPTSVKLQYNSRMANGQYCAIVETYTKTLAGTAYMTDVFCNRIEARGDSLISQSMVKTQSFFHKNESWTLSGQIGGGGQTSRDPWIVTTGTERPMSITRLARLCRTFLPIVWYNESPIL